jgi:tRNA threonylcarbamoyladenosine biosynthesis protein TsaE
MAPPVLTLPLDGPDQTSALARHLADLALPGDVLLLEGPVGAGKTHFARAFIQSLQDAPEAVPSPTYTIIQTYETRKGAVWHADLYRLTDLGELEELGLDEAFETGISLVEWPERLGPMTPGKALHLALMPGDGDDARIARLDWQDARWHGLPQVLS